MTKIYTFHEDEKTGISCDQASSAWLESKLNKARKQEREAIKLDLSNLVEAIEEISNERV